MRRRDLLALGIAAAADKAFARVLAYRGGASAGMAYSPEAVTLFAAMTVQPNAALKAAYNNCIVSLKNAGLWSKLDALYLMDVHDAQAARLNVKNPGTYNLTAVNGPTFTVKTGYAGNGSSASLDTNMNPSTAGGQFTQNAGSAFVWGLKQAADAGGALGQAVGSGAAIVYPRFTDNKAYGRVNANSSTGNVTFANADGRGLFMANRSASNAEQLYINGALASSGANVSVSVAGANFALLRDFSSYFGGGLAMAGIGGDLSGLAANLYAILSTFKAAAEAS